MSVILSIFLNYQFREHCKFLVDKTPTHAPSPYERDAFSPAVEGKLCRRERPLLRTYGFQTRRTLYWYNQQSTFK